MAPTAPPGLGRPLVGLVAGRLDDSLASEIAAWFLAGRGATVLEASPPSGPFRIKGAVAAGAGECARADLVIGREGHVAGSRVGALLRADSTQRPAAGLPPGTIDYAVGAALATAALAAHRAGLPVIVSELGVAIEVFLPDVMAVSYGAPDWTRPGPPVAAPGGGWLSCDLGAAGDDERFAALLSTLPASTTAPDVAEAAQEWRLAVCNYRPWEQEEPEDPILSVAAAPLALPLRPARPGPPLEGVTVVDLTAMWAGPLATRILRTLGATVSKVEPAARLDGTRGLDGKGIYPGGRQRHPGQDSALFNALNRGKDRLPLDLRDPAQRELFLSRARGADLVVESFSPRVMRNFGLEAPVLNSGTGRPTLVSVPAFGPGPRRDWVAYGTGIHALSGLGDLGDGRFAAPAVAYADPVAGFVTAFAAVAALTGRELGVGECHVEVPLMRAVQPLLAFDRPTPWTDGPSGARRAVELFDRGLEAGAFVARDVAGARLMHPRGPFRPPTAV